MNELSLTATRAQRGENEHISAREYLAVYGLSGYVGRFLTPATQQFQRDQPVMLRTDRGDELGHILRESNPATGRLLASHVCGEILRSADESDITLARELTTRARDVVARMAQSDETLIPLDAEILVDESAIIVQILHQEQENWNDWAERLRAKIGLTVVFEDVGGSFGERTGLAAADKGCVESGCGSGSCGSGCGCSTGGCSRGRADSAEQLSTQLAEFRRRSMPTGTRIPLA